MMDAKIWGPHYWFFMMTVALTYPDYPNAVAKRKYYDFFMNLPLFIPDEKMGNKFSNMLDNYPVTPYLSCKDSLTRWVIFIHNKYNEMLGVPGISRDEAFEAYYAQYMPKPIYLHEKTKINRYYLHAAFILVCVMLVFVYST